jgi:hypothetical protein
MVARLDAVILALTVLGGSVMIEDSRRVDTGAADELAAAPASACREDRVFEPAVAERETGFDGIVTVGDEEAAPACGAD